MTVIVDEPVTNVTAAAFAVSGFAVEGVTDDPDVDPSSLGFFPFIDGQVWAALERPVLLDGRLPDPVRSDEVVGSASFDDSLLSESLSPSRRSSWSQAQLQGT